MTKMNFTIEELSVISHALENYKLMLADMNLTFASGDVNDLYDEQIKIALELIQSRVEVVNVLLDKIGD